MSEERELGSHAQFNTRVIGDGNKVAEVHFARRGRDNRFEAWVTVTPQRTRGRGKDRHYAAPADRPTRITLGDIPVAKPQRFKKIHTVGTFDEIASTLKSVLSSFTNDRNRDHAGHIVDVGTQFLRTGQRPEGR